MEELRKKVKELKRLICNIRQIEYACKRNRNVFENAEIDSKILEIDKIIDKVLDK